MLLACKTEQPPPKPKPVADEKPACACVAPSMYADECPDGWAVCRMCRPDCTTALFEVPLASTREDGVPGATKIEWSDGQVATYAYDDKGHFVHKKAGDNERSYKWDGQGRLIWESGPEGEIAYEYETRGSRRITRWLVKGEPPKEDYEQLDDNGRVVESTFARITTKFAYDARGRRVEQASDYGMSTFEYDDRDRLTKRTLDKISVTTFEYDDKGRLQVESLDVLVGGPGNEISTYQYDARGNIARITRSGDQTKDTEFRYDADDNRVERIDFVDGKERSRTRYTYDPRVNEWRTKAPMRAGPGS